MQCIRESDSNRDHHVEVDVESTEAKFGCVVDSLPDVARVSSQLIRGFPFEPAAAAHVLSSILFGPQSRTPSAIMLSFGQSQIRDGVSPTITRLLCDNHCDNQASQTQN